MVRIRVHPPDKERERQRAKRRRKEEEFWKELVKHIKEEAKKAREEHLERA